MDFGFALRDYSTPDTTISTFFSISLIGDSDWLQVGELPDLSQALFHAALIEVEHYDQLTEVNTDIGEAYINVAYFEEYIVPVPVPAAAWLFGSALIGLVGIKRKK